MNLFVYVDCASFLGRFLRQVYQELVGRVLGRWSRGLQIKPSFKMGSHGRGRVREGITAIGSLLIADYCQPPIAHHIPTDHCQSANNQS